MNGLSLPVEYRFAPGEPDDGAALRAPLLALPTLTRAAVDAAIPGLVAPRIVALLRSLPKDARRSLIPIADAAAAFLSFTQAPSADPARLAEWLTSARGIPAAQVRFDLNQVPTHLIPRVAVMEEGKKGALATDLPELRRRFAVGAHAELERRARSDHPTPWRRFEANELADTAVLDLAEGTLTVFQTLAPKGDAVEVRFEWSAAEAARGWRKGAVHLARALLDRQARDLAKTIRADARLLLSAAPYLTGDALVDTLLHLVFRHACFNEGDGPTPDGHAPRTRAAFESAVERGRARLYESFAQMSAAALGWFTLARAVRRLLDDPRAGPHGAAAQETHAHLSRLLSAGSLESLSPEWLRQVPRYLKAEERRWQRVFARGAEAAQILRELQEWTARHRALELEVGAESRWLPELDELRSWIEEYRVSLYAQELKTLGTVSAARLAERAAEIAAWVAR